jgi:hypothetical protein
MRGIELNRVLFLLMAVLMLSCYKQPFHNNEGFMVGKWALVKIEVFPFAFGGGTLPPIEKEIPFHLQFEVEEKGIWKEYVNGNCELRQRVRNNFFRENSGFYNLDYISVKLFEFKSLNYNENYGDSFEFSVNETKDTLTSTSYPPSRLYSRPGFDSQEPRPVFTFVKIQ